MPLQHFWKLMYTLFQDMERCIWYLGNSLIYSGKSEAEQEAKVGNILQQCIECGVAVNLLKSGFHIKDTKL